MIQVYFIYKVAVILTQYKILEHSKQILETQKAYLNVI